MTSFEPAVVFAILIASASGFLFLRLQSKAIGGETWDFDRMVLLSLRHPSDPSLPIGPAWLTKAFIDITALGGLTVLSIVTILSTAYLALVQRRFTAIFLLASVIGGWLISSVVKLGVARPRPDHVSHLVQVHDLSFPSGHAMVSAVTYLTLGLLVAPTQARRAARYYVVCVAGALTLLIGASRVYLGVHYPY